MIRVNDKWDVPWREGMTLVDVIAACGFTQRHVIVSVNGRTKPAAQLKDHPVASGDQVQVIHIVGGG
jgi:thiamine biosynthesis protein ThiS